MGIADHTTLLICAAKLRGVDFARTLTLGRQSFFPRTAVYNLAAEACGLPPDLPGKIGPFADGFFKALGAETVASMDASDYEGATIVHDLNDPVPSNLHGQFSAVFDGGTLEHVFGYSAGLKSALQMVAIGGHFIQCTPANNALGHGFWQAGPEMAYRVFTEENGYRLTLLLLHERGAGWYLVDDPANVARFMPAPNRRRVYMVTIAKREAIVPIFAKAPQQKFSVEQWLGDEPSSKKRLSFIARQRRSVRKRFYRLFPFSAPGFRAVPVSDLLSDRSLVGTRSDADDIAV